jgi:hypothetical protein
MTKYEKPEECQEYETLIKIAVNGEVVAKLETKPSVLQSELEEKAIHSFFAHVYQDGPDDDDTELLDEYDTEFQIWEEPEKIDGVPWTPPFSVEELKDGDF